MPSRGPAPRDPSAAGFPCRNHHGESRLRAKGLGLTGSSGGHETGLSLLTFVHSRQPRPPDPRDPGVKAAQWWRITHMYLFLKYLLYCTNINQNRRKPAASRPQEQYQSVFPRVFHIPCGKTVCPELGENSQRPRTIAPGPAGHSPSVISRTVTTSPALDSAWPSRRPRMARAVRSGGAGCSSSSRGP